MFNFSNIIVNAIGGIISSFSQINKSEYLNIINNNTLNLDEKSLLNILKTKQVSPISIKKSILSEDSETSIIGMILLLANYELYFKRKYIEKFFYFNEINENPENRDMIWEINVFKNNKINLSSFQKELLDAIQTKLISNFNFIISQKVKLTFSDDINNKEVEGEKRIKNKIIFYLSSIFKLLNNIYDLYDKSFLFNADLINVYLKLFDMFVDFNNLPKVTLCNSNIQEDIKHFLTLYCLYMNNDTSYRMRIRLLKNNSEFLLKIVQISTILSGVCCCNHVFYERTYPCQKAIDSIFKLFSHIESQPISGLNNQINFGIFSLINQNKIDVNTINKTKELKIKIADFLCKKAGKNVCFVYLNKLMEICKNNDIVTYLLSKTNLFFDSMQRDNNTEHHLIDCFEKFISLINEPKECLSFLNKLSSYELIYYNRITREMIKKIVSSPDKIIIKSLYDGNVFKNIINLIIDDIQTNKNINLINAEGIFDSILIENKPEIIDIFYQKKFLIKNHFLQLIDYNIKNSFFGYKMDLAFRIMNRFISVGDKIRQKYGGKNFYIEDLRPIYYKINSLSSLNNEDAITFKNYFN